jgi:hypothetical protein
VPKFVVVKTNPNFDRNSGYTLSLSLGRLYAGFDSSPSEGLSLGDPSLLRVELGTRPPSEVELVSVRFHLLGVGLDSGSSALSPSGVGLASGVW